MGSYCCKILEKIVRVEEKFAFQRRTIDSYKKHVIWSSYSLHVTCTSANKRCQETGSYSMRGFWSDSEERSRYHLVTWDVTKRPLSEGDWVWDLCWRWIRRFKESWCDNSWRREMSFGARAKFDMMDRGWYSKVLVRPHGKGMWKIFYMGEDKFQDCVQWRIGDGSRLSFWLVCRLEGGAYRNRFCRFKL